MRELRRLRVGVIGCGLIAQVMYLPLLRELVDRYDVQALCDISPSTLDFCGRNWFPDARRLQNWEDVVADSLDAVLVLTPGSHAPMAVAAAQAGMHVLVEKPVALSAEEGRDMCEAAEAAAVCLMAAYMKRYDPGYEDVRRRVATMRNPRLARVTTVEAPVEPYVRHYKLHRPADADPDLLATLAEMDRARVVAAIGEEAAADPVMYRAYRYSLLDCLIHELYVLRGVLGEPQEIMHASASAGATVITTHFRFGDVECIQAWVDLPGLARYQQEFAFFGDEERVSLSFPSPFLRSAPAVLVTETGEQDSASTRRAEHTLSYDEAFKAELVEFHEAATTHREPRTPVSDALRDLALCQSWVRCAVEHAPVTDPSRTPQVA